MRRDDIDMQANDRVARLHTMLRGSPYTAYLYSYPHKTAHRPLDPAVPLSTLWADERRDALFLYIHVPFCAMRCGYCNLLSQKGRPRSGQVLGFLDALERQARAVRAALKEASFARLAVGGGTPTMLGLSELDRLLDVAQRIMGAEPSIPGCVEVSPETVTREKLALLRERGIDRISVGIQSFVEAELGALRRRQSPGRVHRSLELVRELGFPTLNIDLIYGIEGQDIRGWDVSLDQALRYRPEEIYLYPLYVRPLTQLGEDRRSWDDQRLELYRHARDRLRGVGYNQISMRMFQAPHAGAGGPAEKAPLYRCQQDGMVGLACGARSYTTHLHYSTPYGVSPAAVNALIDAYIARSDRSFSFADHGIRLDAEDRRRRHVIQSLLLCEGLDLAYFRRRFETEALEDLPELAALVDQGLARRGADRLALTEAGLERSDVIGPWLHSDRVQGLMDRHELR
jgi:oxygen-independent coproporphyrinogen-3 oxidase